MKEATAVLKTKVSTLLKGKNGKACRKFLDSMLSHLHTSTGISPVRNTFEKVFNYLAKNVGFSDDTGLYDDYGLTSIVGGRLAVGVNFSKAKPDGAFSLGFIAIHETFHAATSIGAYKEYYIAKAAFDVGKGMGLVPDLVPPPMKEVSEAADEYNTQLINQTIFAACGGNK